MSRPGRLSRDRKPLVNLYGPIKTPPFSQDARIEAGFLLARLQEGASLGLPLSRPMPSIGPRCHELRITDRNRAWRIIYRIDTDAILIAHIFPKTTRTTPRSVIETCEERLKTYDRDTS